MHTPAEIRPATRDDLPAITEIYAHHVLTGLASFEEAAPPLEEMTRRFGALTGKGFPYFVAFRDGQVVGYAYAGPYHTRSAYRYTVEDSVYMHPQATGLGAGGALLDAVIDACEDAGFRQMLAVIGDSANAASIGLHTSRGFAPAGKFRAVGFKFGRWIDSVLMQRPLGPGATDTPE